MKMSSVCTCRLHDSFQLVETVKARYKMIRIIISCSRYTLKVVFIFFAVG